jgi:hypothetical protein
VTNPSQSERDERGPEINEIVSKFDAPAYVRRARQVEEAFAQLLAAARGRRAEWLTMVRLRLGLLRAHAGAWEALAPLLEDAEQVAELTALHDALQPRLRVRIEPTASIGTLRRALRELTESIERFNRRWAKYLQGLDLTHVNKLRDGYNRYYLLEKECAVRSPLVARQGFRRLGPLTVDDLTALLPPLPVPRYKG